MYNTPIETEGGKNIVEKWLNENDIKGDIILTPKGYFSNDYIENHKNVMIKYLENGQANYLELK